MRRAAVTLMLAGCLSATSCGLIDTDDGSPAARGGLSGVDADGDGVRDDVAAAIGQLPVTQQMRTYLTDRARVEQRIMLLDATAPGARDDAYAIAADANRLISCLPEGLDVGQARKYAGDIQSLVENTPGRDAQVGAFARLIDGRDFPAPTCPPSAGR